MNKFIKIMLITSIIVSIVGIIFVGIGTLTGSQMGLRVRGTGIEIIGKDKIQEIDLELEEFNSIDIDLSYADVVIEKGSGYGIEIFYHESQYIPEYSVNEGVLYVTDNSQDQGFFNYLNIDMSFGLEKTKVVVYLPVEESVENYAIDVTSGTTTLNLSGTVEDYNMDIRAYIGKVAVNNDYKGFRYKKQVENSEKQVDVINNMGIVDIKFE